MARLTAHRKRVRRIVGLLTLFFAILTIAAPKPCFAQWDPKKQFNEGLTRFDKGDFEGALPFFENVFSRTESPNARLYLARCLAKLDRHAEAYKEMKGTVDIAGAKADTEPKYASTRDTAAAELVQLEDKVGKVIVAFSEPYNGAEASVNGRTLDVDQHGIPQIVSPGSIEVTASAPGKQTFNTTIEIEGGQTQTVAVALDDDLGDIGDDAEGSGLGTLQWVGIGVGALGIGGFVAFAITGSQASSKFDQVKEECGGERCTDPKYADVIDDGKSLQTIANVTLAIGAVLTAAGIALIIFGGDSDDGGSGDTASVAGTVTIAPLPGGLSLSSSF